MDQRSAAPVGARTFACDAPARWQSMAAGHFRKRRTLKVKRSRILCVIVLLALLWSLCPSMSAPTVQAQTENSYQDPAGLFTAPVPTGWTAESKAGYALFTDPDKVIRVYIVPVDGDAATAAIAPAWQLAQPGFDLKEEKTVTVPASNGLDEVVQAAYKTDEKRIVMAIAERVGGKVYAILVDADKDAAIKRNSQLGIITSGLTIATQKKDDLTGVEPKPVNAAVTAELDAYVQDVMRRAGVPGAVIAVVQDGRVVHTQAFGVKEQGKPEPMLPTTRMMIGSTGKTLTTLMMATLVDDGKMTWDTPAVQILPSFAVADPALSKQITMRNLVCACTGVPRRDLELLFNAADLTPDQVVESLKTFQFFTKFGEAFQYSNQMVGTGGYIAAIAGGGDRGDLFGSYATQLQQRVLAPVGMTHTTLSFDEVTKAGDYATPHGLDLLAERHPIPLDIEKMLLPIAPAGAHWSTVGDMARYLLTLMNDGVTPEGRRVVSSANLKVLWQPQVPIDAQTGYGLGWIVGKYKKLSLIQHGGNTLGFTSELSFLPDARLGLVLLANGQGANAFSAAVRGRLLELVGQASGQGDRDFTFGQDFQKKSLDELKGTFQPLDAVAVQPYAGAYRNPALGQVTLRLDDGKLMLEAKGFSSALQKKTDKDGKVTYVTIDPPLAGLPFELGQSDGGQLRLVLKWAPDSYTFERQ
jgi:CubicO group peptidase (beta-lactamase class C family)